MPVGECSGYTDWIIVCDFYCEISSLGQPQRMISFITVLCSIGLRRPVAGHRNFLRKHIASVNGVPNNHRVVPYRNRLFALESPTTIQHNGCSIDYKVKHTNNYRTVSTINRSQPNPFLFECVARTFVFSCWFFLSLTPFTCSFTCAFT